MNKVPVYEVKAPCVDTSFEVASGNNSASSPKSQEPESFADMIQYDGSENLRNDMEDDDLRCHESIQMEGLSELMLDR